MGFLRWVASLFRPQPSQRNIATLTDVEEDALLETVISSNEPIKPLHLRRSVRDPRLMPKPRRVMNPVTMLLRRRPKYLSEDEADRLFSTSLRTRNRALRDLAADEEQLQRYGLPAWKSESDIAAAIGITVRQLRHYSIHRDRERCCHYVTFAIPKRGGGHRLIHAPKRRLKAIQRTLVATLVSKLPMSEHAHGFRTGRSIASNAACHVGRAVVVKLDLKDCFPSIHFGRVRGLLIGFGYSYPVATTLALLMTEAKRQPVAIADVIYHVPIGPRFCVQGAPTSPGLCNAILQRLDRRLGGLAKKYGYRYTRYADDLTFSGDEPAHLKALVQIACKIVREEGMQINRKKTRILRRSQRQTVTGVVVNEQMGLSRQERRRLRAAVHQLTQKPIDPQRLEQLRGRIAYLRMLNPKQAAPLLAQLE